MRAVNMIDWQEVTQRMEMMHMIDWQQVTLNLQSNYAPITAIAREIGATRGQLAKINAGVTQAPAFHIGIKLLDLHYDVMQDKHDSVLIHQRGQQNESR
jgi:hypothetical protein